MKPVLVFVYNADSGIFNTVTDIAHKIFSPKTYSCNLCAITFGNFAMRQEWKEFLEKVDADLEFLHRDELAERYGIADAGLPAVFLKAGDRLETWINKAEIDGCSSIDELKSLVNGKLSR